MPTALIVGAGIFGTSLAYRLTADGWAVTLIDQYPPGHVRAASGDESRVIRFSHGSERWYVRSARRARTLWQELEDETSATLFVPSGAVWFAYRDDGWEAESEAVLREEGIPVERLTPSETASLFPNLAQEDLAFAVYEPDAGVLHARKAVRLLFEAARTRGMTFVPGTARPANASVTIDDETLPAADCVVWACGAWLPKLFPELVDIVVTKQDVFFYGCPLAWETPPVPVWVDYDHSIYGLGDLDGRGFKVAPDREGPEFDPDQDARVPSEEREHEARDYLTRRFPALATAPLVGTRTCPYALTPDTHFVIAPHPDQEGVWLLGGGSGHGFKHGPTLAEYVARLLAGDESPDDRFSLAPRRSAKALRTAGGFR